MSTFVRVIVPFCKKVDLTKITLVRQKLIYNMLYKYMYTLYCQSSDK